MSTLPPLSRGLRLVLVASLATTYVAAHTHAAYAKKGSSDSDSDSDSDDSSDDSDSDKDSDKDSDNSDSDTGEDNPDKDQPPVTAGGLFTMKTYPTSEIARPLTLTQNVMQVQFGLGTDLSAIGAFNTGGFNLDVSYGLKDNFMLIGGFDNAYNMKQYSVYFGFEGSLIYDLLDIRIAADLHRFAYPLFCQTPGTVTSEPMPSTCDSTAVGLPDGNYFAGGTQFSIDLGFPFRYPFTPGIAVVALQTLMSIDFNGTQRGNYPMAQMSNPNLPAYCSGIGTDSMGNPVTADPDNCYENLAKPDLNPSLGVAFNPIPQLSIVVFGQLRIPDFDTAAGNFRIPVTLQVEASPNSKFDFGLAFTLLNVAPPDPEGPLDNRFLSAYVRARFGK